MIRKKKDFHPAGILPGSAKQLFLILAGIVAAYPIYYMVVTAFKTRQDWLDNQFGLPHLLNWSNFTQALDQGKLFLWFRNSVIVTLVIVNALWVWNELLVALVFLQSEDLKTLMPGLTLFKGHFTINEPLIMAGTLIATLPMILLYLFGQKFFVEGMVAVAVK